MDKSPTAKELKDGVLKELSPTPHKKILAKLLQQVSKINFRNEAKFDKDQKLYKKHYIIIFVEKILELADNNNWGLCNRNDFIYLYNGAYWSQLDEKKLKTFLGKAAHKMGIDKFDSLYYRFKDELLKQFVSEAYLPPPSDPEHVVLINLKNGTLEINPEGSELIKLRDPKSEDFITYQLPFNYNKNATAPKFQQHLDYVLPDKNLRKIFS